MWADSRGRRRARATFALLFSIAVAVASGQAPPAADESSTGIPIGEVKAGMRGHGLSVFRGTVPERFDVEVLGVLENAAPDETYILARLSGRNLESTGVIAGMSGSPVYLDGRLAGAVAFSWPFAEEAIAGITPIANMRAIGAKAGGGARNGGARAQAAPDWNRLVSPPIDGDPLAEQLEHLAAFTGGDGRGGLSWGASGFGPAARARLATALPALAPLSLGAVSASGGAGASSGASPGGAAELARLAPGGSVAALFVDGDLRLAATGTVTDRDGDRLLAFGHAVTGLGEISMPLAPAEVITVFPSALSSFKLANSGVPLGAFVRDNPSGCAGEIGVEARMVPVALTLEGEGGRSFAFRVADAPQLVPSLTAIAVLGAWDSTIGFDAGRSVDLELEVAMASRAPLRLRQTFDGTGAPMRAIGYVGSVLDFVERNDFGPLAIESIALRVAVRPDPQALEIRAVRPDRTRLAPGETVTLQIDTVDWNGATARRSEAVRLPGELPDGRYTLLVGDGASADAARLQLVPAPPTTLDQVLELLASLRSSRDLVVLGVLPAGGLAVAGEAMPRLPGSIRSIWNLSGVRGATPLRYAVLQNETRQSERPLAGLVRFDVEIRRRNEGGKAE